MWYHKFDTYMVGLGFVRSKVDHCVYYKKVSEHFIYAVLYVYVGAEDHMVKCDDAEDRRIKERTKCSSHEQPVRREDKGSALSAEGVRCQS